MIYPIGAGTEPGRLDAKTLGEYTNLQDADGKDIYEGDIVSDGRKNYIVHYEGAAFRAADVAAKNVGDLPLLSALLNSGQQVRVVGNIHQNPELLEVKER